MTKRYILISLTLFSYALLQAQTVDWVTGSGGSGTDSGRNIVVDSQGSVFVSGTFEDTVKFDPNSNDYTFTASQNGDAYLQKFDAAGNFLWAKVWISNALLEYPIITIDSSDNIYFSAFFQHTVDLDPGPNEDLRVSEAQGFNDSYIVKLNNDGEYIWGEAFENGSSNQITEIFDIEVDKNNGLIVIGGFQGTVDFDFGTDQHLETSTGLGTFFMHMDLNGEFNWVKILGGGNKSVNVTKVTFDSQNNIIIGGSFHGTDVDFDPGLGVASLSSPVANNDLYVLKLDSLGNYLWVKTAEGIDLGPLNGIGNDQVLSLAVDSNNDIYVSGGFSHSINFEPGSNDFFLDSGVEPCTQPPCLDFTTSFMAKMTANGEMVWAKNFEGEHRVFYGQGNEYSHSNLVVVTENDALFFTLNPLGDIEIEVNSESVSYNSDSSYLTFLNVDRNTGAVNQAFFMGNEDFTFMSDFCIKNFRIYATGAFGGTLVFDDSNSLSSYENSRDAFTLKMASEYLAITDTQMISEFKIFPNPTFGAITCANLKNDISSIAIYNAQGNMLRRYSTLNMESRELDLSGYFPGIYYLVAESNYGRKRFQKIIKK